MLDAKLKRLIRKGSLGITWPNGQTRFYGSVSGRGPDVAIQITGTLTPLKLGLHPDLYIGETYMEEPYASNGARCGISLVAALAAAPLGRGAAHARGALRTR